MIIRSEKNSNYSVIDNTVFRDRKLSWKAKGMLSYLLSLPGDWKIHMDDLITRSTDGETSTRSAMNELIESGYIVRKTLRKDGVISGCDYIVFEKPQTQNSEEDTDDAEEKIEQPESVANTEDSLDHGNHNPGKPSLLNTNTLNTNYSSYSKNTQNSISPLTRFARNSKYRNWINGKVALADSYSFSETTRNLILQWYSDLVEVGCLLPQNSLVNQLSQLKKLSENERNAVLEETITNGWKSLLYAINNLKKKNCSYDSQESVEQQFYTEEEKQRLGEELRNSSVKK